LGDAASEMERAARDLRIALGNASGRTALNAVRDRKGQDLGVMGLDDFMARLGQEVEARTQ